VLWSAKVISRVNGDILSKQQYINKVKSDNENKTQRTFAMFIAAGAKLTTPAVKVMMDSTRKTVLAAFCPYKAGQGLSLIQSDRQTQGLKR